jgi:hypothetical protein
MEHKIRLTLYVSTDDDLVDLIILTILGVGNIMKLFYVQFSLFHQSTLLIS